MQTPEVSAPHGWTAYVGFVFGFIASAFAIYREWRNRNKPQFDLDHTEAITQRTRAETKRIELEVNLSAGDMLLRMSDKLDRVQGMLWDSERDNAKLRSENDILTKQLERYAAEDKLRELDK